MNELRVAVGEADAARIERLIASGRYTSADEAVHQSLWLAEIVEHSPEARAAALRAAIQAGLDDVAAGRCSTFTSVEAMREALGARLQSLLAEPEL